jgi:hypothetical protein
VACAAPDKGAGRWDTARVKGDARDGVVSAKRRTRFVWRPCGSPVSIPSGDHHDDKGDGVRRRHGQGTSRGASQAQSVSVTAAACRSRHCRFNLGASSETVMVPMRPGASSSRNSDKFSIRSTLGECVRVDLRPWAGSPPPEGGAHDSGRGAVTAPSNFPVRSACTRREE